MKLLAETEGIWTETAGGVTLAVAQKLIEQGRIDRDESIVVCITGNGLKTQEPLLERMPKPVVIKPTLEEFEALLETHLAGPGRQPRPDARPSVERCACAHSIDRHPMPIATSDRYLSKDQTMPVVRIPTPLRPHAGGLDRSKPPAPPSARSWTSSAPSIPRSANGSSTATSCAGSSTSM